MNRYRMIGAIAFAVILSVVVVFHEGAHFLFAKLFGVKVIRFSVGFGPVLYRKKIGETEYQIAAIPVGGFILPLSADLPAAYDKYKEPSHPEKYFESKPAWQRMVIYLVGPLSNLLFAFLLYFSLFATIGSYYGTTTLDSVNKNSPAESAGLKAGDTVLSVDGNSVLNWDEVGNYIQKKKGAPVHLVVSRSDKNLEVVVIPIEQATKTGARFLIGILPKVKSRPLGISASLAEAGKVTAEAVGLFWNFFKELLTGRAKKDSVGGIIMIYQATSQSAKQGLLAMLDIVIMLNLNLFFFNILPIPLLDGGQIYPAIFEMLTGIRFGERFAKLWQYIGLLMLLSLFLLGAYNDIVRTFFK